jgi:ribosome modulation factor
MPKDACPYPRNSEERLSWMEGYDGRPRDLRT